MESALGQRERRLFLTTSSQQLDDFCCPEHCIGFHHVSTDLLQLQEVVNDPVFTASRTHLAAEDSLTWHCSGSDQLGRTTSLTTALSSASTMCMLLSLNRYVVHFLIVRTCMHIWLVEHGALGKKKRRAVV